MRFVGRLSRKDPLYEYLRDEILPQLNIREVKPDFKVFRLPPQIMFTFTKTAIVWSVSSGNFSAKYQIAHMNPHFTE